MLDQGTLDAFNFIGANGLFPMAIAGYLLIRVEKKLDALTAAIINLRGGKETEKDG